MIDPESFLIDSDGLALAARRSVYDAESVPFPVAVIDLLQLRNESAARDGIHKFEHWRDACGFGLVSCRLAHGKLRESIFLEENGFRFIEMVLKPRIQLPDHIDAPQVISEPIPADAADIPMLRGIAERAFGFERFHVDPRLDSRWGDARYGRWIENAWRSSAQRVMKIQSNGATVGFFVYEQRPERKIYWHLTALDPDYAGKGLGKQAWLSMMALHRRDGYSEISTTISARNTPVLNLYSSLNFRFSPAEMTFHWVR